MEFTQNGKWPGFLFKRAAFYALAATKSIVSINANEKQAQKCHRLLRYATNSTILF